VIATSVALLLVSVGLLAVGLATGATPVLLATVLVALAALVPLARAVVRTRPPVSDRGPRPTDPTPPDRPTA
jgi:hypothetical protein